MKAPGSFTELFQKSLGSSKPPEGPADPARPELSPAEEALVAALVDDGPSIQDRFKPEPLFQQTGRGHYESQSIEEIREAKTGAARFQSASAPHPDETPPAPYPLASASFRGHQRSSQ